MVFVPVCGLMAAGLAVLGLIFDRQKHLKVWLLTVSTTLILLAIWAGLQRHWASILDSGGGG